MPQATDFPSLLVVVIAAID